MFRDRFAVPKSGKFLCSDRADLEFSFSNPNAPSSSFPLRNDISSDSILDSSSELLSSAALCSISMSVLLPRSVSFSSARRWFSDTYRCIMVSARLTRVARSVLLMPKNSGSIGTDPMGSPSKELTGKPSEPAGERRPREIPFFLSYKGGGGPMRSGDDRSLENESLRTTASTGKPSCPLSTAFSFLRSSTSCRRLLMSAWVGSCMTDGRLMIFLARVA
mmetsp:Transcript_6375/g.25911  ORF Transcript_6375/g.25911 Transcript_6375/m.25911 type:complete len:219 (+) Transcript_6375:2667-3323(+)